MTLLGALPSMCMIIEGLRSTGNGRTLPILLFTDSQYRGMG